jgi:hypothetical protein
VRSGRDNAIAKAREKRRLSQAELHLFIEEVAKDIGYEDVAKDVRDGQQGGGKGGQNGSWITNLTPEEYTNLMLVRAKACIPSSFFRACATVLCCYNGHHSFISSSSFTLQDLEQQLNEEADREEIAYLESLEAEDIDMMIETHFPD